MAASLIEKNYQELKPQAETLSEEDKINLCRKMCLNIFEGLAEGYEELKQKNPHKAESIDSKICELKCMINLQELSLKKEPE